MTNLNGNYKIGAIESPIDDLDYIFETMVKSAGVDNKLPKKIDYRDVLKNAMNQGSQNTCAAFAAIACKEWQELAEIKTRINFSTQYIYNNRPNYPNEGMYGRDVMDILLKKGCCRERFYRYGNFNTISDTVNQDASNFKISSYARVNTLDGLKNALHMNGPCYIAFPIYNTKLEFWKPENNEEQTGGHAVCIVGYDDDKKHFIIRNSWGYLWGDKGHTYFPYLDFGIQWEIWSMIDNTTVKPEPEILDDTTLCEGCILL